MSIIFLESFGWSESTSGNSWVDRGYNDLNTNDVIEVNQVYGREGSGFACVRFSLGLNDSPIVFPIARRTPMTFGLCYSNTTGSSGTVMFRIDLGTVGTTGARIDVTATGINYRMGPNTYRHDIISNNGQFVFMEFQISSTFMALRVNNEIVGTLSGSSFSAGTGNLTISRIAVNDSGTTTISDIYVADDMVFRGDSYVKLLPLQNTIENTGVKEGPAATVAEALTNFEQSNFVSYDTSGELTTLSVGDIVGNVSSVKGLGLRLNTVKTNNDSVTAIPYIDTSARYEFAGHSPGLNYAPVQYYTDNDPVDSTPLTQTKINNLNVGIKRL